MKTFKRKLSMMLTLIVSISALTVMPVAARGIDSGGDDSTSGSQNVATSDSGSGSGESGQQSSGSGNSSGSSTSGSNSSGDLTDNENLTGDNSNDPQDLKKKGANDLAELRKVKKEVHSIAERQKSCKALQTEINNKIAKFGSNAQKHLDTFNDIFTKVQAFQSSKNLNVTNYDTLVATATAKQTTATASVASLKSVAVNVDCSAPDPASSIATVKAAVAQTHDDLQAYRLAIKDIVVALQGAKTANSTSTTGAQQ